MVYGTPSQRCINGDVQTREGILVLAIEIAPLCRFPHTVEAIDLEVWSQW